MTIVEGTSATCFALNITWENPASMAALAELVPA